VDTVEEAVLLIRAHPMSSTGRLLNNYVSFISGKPATRSCQRSDGLMHTIILDNGRRTMREDTLLREALQTSQPHGPIIQLADQKTNGEGLAGEHGGHR
jgi:L-lactate utilization protein LutB